VWALNAFIFKPFFAVVREIFEAGTDGLKNVERV
jgi:hypothetical protein